MANKKYLDKDGLLYYNEKLKNILNAKADISTVNTQISALDTKINTTNSNLSTLRTTTESSIDSLEAKDVSHDTDIANLKSKDTAHDTAITNLQTSDTAHGTAIASLQASDTAHDSAISSLEAKDLSHDTAIASLNNNKADKTEVTQEIADAIAGVTQFDYEIVEELPEEGVKGVIYLVEYSHSEAGDIYQEFIWIESEGDYETLGYTNEIDLTNYVTFDDTITNSDIDAMFSAVSEEPSGE